MRPGPDFSRTKLHPNGSTDAVLDNFAYLSPTPTITTQSLVHDWAVLTPTRSFSEGFDPNSSRKLEVFRQFHLLRPVVQEDCVLILKVTAATPAITFGPERQRAQERRSTYGSPGDERLFVIRSEVDEPLTAWRQVTTALVNSPFQPLAFIKLIGVRAPQYQQDTL